MMVVLLVIFVVVFVVYLFNDMKKPPNFPPGPCQLPFVGNLPEIKKLSKKLGGQHLAFLEMAKMYKTNVLGLKFGKENVIVTFSYSLVREILNSEIYNARPDTFFLRLRCMGSKNGITCADGELHTIQRNFVIRHFRNLGFGRKTMELMINDEIDEILKIFETTCDIQIGKILAPAVLNILWTLTTGSRFAKGDSQLNKLLDLLEMRSKAFDMSGGILNQWSWLRFIAPQWTGYNLILKLNAELKQLMMNTIKEHQQNWNENRNDDLIYAYITEMKNSKLTKSNEKNTFTNNQLMMVCLDIFIAGSQTTSNTLDFAFLMMILHPHIQNKVHQIIDQYLQEDDLHYSDRHKVPFIEAVLLEIERFCHVVPIIGPRRTLKNTILDGYTIPKNTTVLMSVHSVHNDKEFWKDPEKFRPERFLNEEGKIHNHDRLFGFGLGKRRCLGEILARSCIFMFFVKILKYYEISIKPGSAKPTGKPLPGITLSPEKYSAKFAKRKTLV